MKLLRCSFLGLAAGLVVGALVLGVGGRLVMSIIAAMGGLRPVWSLGGASEVVVFGAFVGAGCGLILGLVEAKLPGGSLAKGLIVGVLLFGAMVLVQPSSARSAMAGFTQLTGPVMLLFGMISLVFGVMLAVVFERLKKRRSHPF